MTSARALLVIVSGVLCLSAAVHAQETRAGRELRITLDLIAAVNSKDSSAHNVAKIQRSLVEAGFDPGPINGELGEQTIKALHEWKESTGRSISLEWTDPENAVSIPAKPTKSVTKPAAKPVKKPATGQFPDQTDTILIAALVVLGIAGRRDFAVVPLGLLLLKNLQ